MKSYREIAFHPTSLSISADEIIEFHLARILLLIKLCGRNNRVAGLTKFAKLDFFVRYPEFFDRARGRVDKPTSDPERPQAEFTTVESSMVRHHYGPWDKRYYHLLAHLTSTGLINVEKSGRTYNIGLTDAGRKYADQLIDDDAFGELSSHMRQVSRVFGGKNGTALKNLIYETFEDEVAEKSLGEDIK